MNWLKKYAKRIGFDVAGYTLIILGITLGWLPGPGGIPLILGGLALLAVHNAWAKNLLLFAKEKGDQLVYALFPKNKFIQILHDILTIVLVSIGSYLLYLHTNFVFIGVAAALFALAAADFCFNRKRLHRLLHKR